MTREDIEKELDIINQRINNADEYFKNQPYNPNIDNTREWKLLKSLINRGVQLQDVLNTMEGR